MTKTAKPLLCCAPMCVEAAFQRLDLSGKQGDFSGDLCQNHAAMMQEAFPCSFSSVALLVAISAKEMQQGLRRVFGKTAKP